ncbi:DUF3800 domain-containing protein [Microbacterium halophytorum]|uniref:DUF3800 domain-containing protein n=1 Tax=Microbacterium halophytorum TaxID=2067568 RepID=UPI000CFC678A|nr:DUF3800 domain-containing protein [Microbacterium halophytorum]
MTTVVPLSGEGAPRWPGRPEGAPPFSEYVVYVDESGDHGLAKINPDYPVFVLAFCIFHIPTYVGQIVPDVQRLKFKYFGHDMVVLHETEIRKQAPPFEILRDQNVRGEFMSDMNDLIIRSPFAVTASVILKEEYRLRRGESTNPYHVALELGLERVFLHLQSLGQRGRPTRVVFEGRGKKEDAELELEFRRIMDRTQMQGMAQTLDFLCASKQANSTGLQVADMIARPIGLHVLRPEQENRAWDIILPKMRTSPSGRVDGYGLKVFA